MAISAQRRSSARELTPTNWMKHETGNESLFREGPMRSRQTHWKPCESDMKRPLRFPWNAYQAYSMSKRLSESELYPSREFSIGYAYGI